MSPLLYAPGRKNMSQAIAPTSRGVTSFPLGLNVAAGTHFVKACALPSALRRRERCGVLLVGFEPLVFDVDAAHTSGIGALGMRGQPILR